MTQDCPVGLAARVRRRVAKSIAMTVTAMSVLATWALNYRWNNGATLWEQWRMASQPEIMQGGAAPISHMMMGEVAMPLKSSASPVQPQPKPLTR